MSPLPPDDLNRITDYVAEELSPDEAEATGVWIAEDERRQNLVGYLRRSAQSTRGQTTHVNVDTALAVIAAHIDASTVASRDAAIARHPQRSAKPSPLAAWRTLGETSSLGRWPLLKGVRLGKQSLRGSIFSTQAPGLSLISVASVILLCVIGVSIFISPKVRSLRHLRNRSYTTVAGQQASVTLSDGSRALLGPATTLTATVQSSNPSIDVHVTGQVHFTISGSPYRPFRVHVGNAVAHVLGTTFMVRKYETDSVVQVVVTEGRVSLAAIGGRTRDAGQVLVSNMVGTVNDSGDVHTKTNITGDEYTGWTTGQLVFHRTPARDVAIELGRAYGVDIRISDSTLARQSLSWTVVLMQRSLPDVLELLVDLLDAHSVQTGRVITLVPGRSSSRRPIGQRVPLSLERQYGR